MSSTVVLPPDGLLADGTKPGGWWHETDEPGRVMCDLCPRACVLRPGDRGFCFVRENRDGQMLLSTYGRSTGFCIDPIEKKPLNHFYPGTSVLSFGTAGCNLGCKFCQNWSISKSREIEQLSEQATPETIAEAARQLGCRSVAFTYNDPVIWAEYAIDTAKACRAAGIKSVAVTAGYITPQARGAFYEYMDAANVDLKGFTEHFYKHLTLSHLQPVLDTLHWLKHETDVWFEITNLVIPEENDSLDEIGQMCDWILEHVGPDVPLHFTAFHPDFRLMNRPRTPAETLLAAHELARRKGLNHVYVGNIPARDEQTTYCPQCRRPLVERDGYTIHGYRLRGSSCGYCGAAIAGRYDEAPGDWGSRRLPVRISSYSRSTPQPTVATMSTPELVQIETQPANGRPQLSTHQEQAILRAAGELVCAAVAGQEAKLTDPTLAGAADQPVLGAFVTLTRRGRLRGCCGFLGQQATLGKALAHAAGRSANDDPRFPPVVDVELPHLEAEVWLLYGLSPVKARGPQRCGFVEIGRHGLQIERARSRGLLLPGVAVEHGFDAEAFLEQVCLKAGLPPTAWKEDDTELSTFEGYSFSGKLIIDEMPVNAPGSVLSRADLEALAQFCRSNILAVAEGATPSYYAYGVTDYNVHGVAIVLNTADGAQWLQASRISLRQPIPLQASLYSLAESVGNSLRQGGSLRRLGELSLGVAALEAPALHGTVEEPDLDGIDTRQRGVLVCERNRLALCFNHEASPHQLLGEAIECAVVQMPQAAAVYSLQVATNSNPLRITQSPRPQAGSEVRPPAVAGAFYPADAGELSKLVDRMLANPAPPPEKWPAVMVPHAGLMYSGRIAAGVLQRVEIPGTVIVIGPKHTALGVDWAIAPHQAWSIPGATIASDPQLARELVQAIEGLELDAAAHQQEHGIEVELPWIARLAPQARVVGIAIGAGNLAMCRRFAEGLARVMASRQERPLLVISSDMNHFASDEENRRLDEMALAALETLDAERLLTTCRRHHISMCGVLPAVIVMETLKRLGGLVETERAGYATSADASGDRSRVVGYAGMLLR